MENITVTEVTSPNCVHCAAFKKWWDEISGDWPNVQFKAVSITETEGEELVQQHMIMASPGIIINGELFSTGGVDQKKFVAKLKELAGDE